MFRKILIALGLVASTCPASEQTAYDFAFGSLPLSKYKGQVLLVVNTASKCGLVGQFAELEELYKLYKDRGLVIVGVPTNDFAGQEPKENDEIQSFCSLNYGVTFPISPKDTVKHPFFAWTRESLGYFAYPRWNFTKILINREGKAIKSFLPTTSPSAKRVKKAIEACLQKE